MPVKAIPTGYHTVTPYIMVPDGHAMIDFLQAAFGAKVVRKMLDPTGAVRHAELQIGDSMVMLAQSCGEYPAMPMAIYLYVPDTDAVYRAAVRAGASSMSEPKDQFYGDRSAGVRDAFGNFWWIGTHVEDVSDEELESRAMAQPQRKAS